LEGRTYVPTQATLFTVELLLVVVGIETTCGAEIVATEIDTTIRATPGHLGEMTHSLSFRGAKRREGS
jgi:hypothetical protein